MSEIYIWCSQNVIYYIIMKVGGDLSRGCGENEIHTGQCLAPNTLLMGGQAISRGLIRGQLRL